MTRRLPEHLVDPISADYIAWCERENTPANTIKRRRAVLRSVGNAGVATREEIEAWWTTQRHLKDSSRANALAVLRSFYTWCQVWEHRVDNPTVRIKSPKADEGAPKPYSAAELHKILAGIAQHSDRYREPLRRAALLGAWGGLRIEETTTLDWSEIDPETRRARVTGKGRKTRVVKFSTKLIEELLPVPDGGGNVVTGRPRAWSVDHLGRLMNNAIRDAGVDGTYHRLRHRYGSVGYQRTKDPKALAEMMGHASVSTTLKFYAAAGSEAADNIADAVVDD